MSGKRIRNTCICVWVRPDELEAIKERMAEAGMRNMAAYMRKMALNGYVLHVDLSPVKKLVSLQRRCSNNLNQVAIHANTYDGSLRRMLYLASQWIVKYWHAQGAVVLSLPYDARGGIILLAETGKAFRRRIPHRLNRPRA